MRTTTFVAEAYLPYVRLTKITAAVTLLVVAFSCSKSARAVMFDLAVLSSSSMGQAATVASNFGGDNSSNGALQNSAGTAQQFTTDAQAYSLSSVVLHLQQDDSGDEQTIEISLFSDSAGVPDSQIGPSFSDPPITALGNYEFTASGQVLESNTSYWIVGLVPGTDRYGQRLNVDIVNTGPVSINNLVGNSFDDGANWNVLSGQGAFRMEINASIIPEPTTLALAGLGLVGVACVRRRRL